MRTAKRAERILRTKQAVWVCGNTPQTLDETIADLMVNMSCDRDTVVLELYGDYRAVQSMAKSKG